MKLIYTSILILFSIAAWGQNFNTLKFIRAFATEEELAKAYPQLVKTKVVSEKSEIKLLDKSSNLKLQVSKSRVPANLNSFIFSPLRDHFVGYEETEEQSKDLLFFSSDGTLLAKQIINIYPNIKFSSNGEYVVAFNHFGREIFVFTKKGQLIFSGDYIKLINDKSKILDNVFVSEDATEIILNAGNAIYSFNSKTKREIFRTEIGGWALEGNMYSSNGLLALKVKTVGSQNKKFTYKAISKVNGKVLDEVSGFDQIEFMQSGVVMLKDSKISEYAFQK